VRSQDTLTLHNSYNPQGASDADTPDTNAFEALSQGAGLLMTANTGKIAMDEPSNMPEARTEHLIESESHFSDTSTVIIDYFPFGNPGAPISGIA